MMDEQEVLEVINSGEDSAYGILYDADPKLVQRFKRVDKSMSKLLDDVKKHFPGCHLLHRIWWLIIGS